jgi:hypothetical protein
MEYVEDYDRNETRGGCYHFKMDYSREVIDSNSNQQTQ